MSDLQFMNKFDSVINQVDVFEGLIRGLRFSLTKMDFEVVYLTSDEDFEMSKEIIEEAVQDLLFNDVINDNFYEEGSIKISEDFYRDGRVILVSPSYTSTYS